MLTFRGRAWYVEDLESTNGTFVNGVPGRPRRGRSGSATSSRWARSGSASTGVGSERRRRRPDLDAASLDGSAPARGGPSSTLLGLVVRDAARGRGVARREPERFQQTLDAGEPVGPRLHAAGPRGPARLPRRAGRRPPAVRPRGPTDRPGPAAGDGDARRDRPAADAAAAAGARRPVVRRRRAAASASSSSAGSLLALTVDRGARARGPLGRLAADLQVHVGRGRASRSLLATFVFGIGRQRRAPDALDRAAVRAAVRAAEGHPRRVPRGIPVREPLAAGRREHAASGRSACRRSRTSRRWSRWSRSRSGSSSSSGTSARPSCSSRCSSRCCTWRPAARRTSSAAWPLFLVGSWVLYNLFGHVQQRVDNWLDPFARPARRGLPDRPGAVRVRARRAARRRASARACRRSAAGCRSRPCTRTIRSRRWARSWA